MAKFRYGRPGAIAVLLACGSVFFTSIGAAFGAAAPTAITGAVTAKTPNSAEVSGAVNPNGQASTWYFQVGLSSSTKFTIQTSPASAGSGSSAVNESASITGLASATSYRYRLVASNPSGTTYGQVGIFNTTAPPSAVTGAASQLGASSASLNAVVNPEAMSTKWYFEYGPSPSLAAKTTTRTLGASPNDANVSVKLTGLAPHTQYSFRVVAMSAAGTSTGSELNFNTGRSVTLNASASTVVYGQFVTLSGTVTSGLAGQHVTVLAEPFDAAGFGGVADVVTGSGGRWSYRAQPRVRTSYEASAEGGTSSVAVLSVRPAVFLTKVAHGRLVTRIVGSMSFGSHVLQLQRLEQNLWVTWKSVRLDASGKATFTTSLPRGRTLIRMAVGPFVAGINQAAPGYLAGFSRQIVYVRR